QAATRPPELAARCSSAGAAKRPERSRSQDRSAPAAVVTATPASTPAVARLRSPARPLTRSAPAVGRTCQTPNTTLGTVTAAPVRRRPRRPGGAHVGRHVPPAPPRALPGHIVVGGQDGA